MHSTYVHTNPAKNQLTLPLCMTLTAIRAGVGSVWLVWSSSQAIRLMDTPKWSSFGARLSKNRIGGSGKFTGVKVYAAPGVQAHFWLAFEQHFDWLGNANRTRTVFAFCFILESYKHQAGKIECLYVSGSAENSTGFARFGNTFPSVHFHPTPFTRPSFSIFRGSGSETNNGEW